MSICDLLCNILPNTPDKVQAWSAVITTGLAGYALFSWKHQKNYEIYLQALGQYQIHGAKIIDLASDYWTLFNNQKNANE